MSSITIYHNPNCSKSRGAREILEASGKPFEIIEYLEHPLSAEKVHALLAVLSTEPADLLRKDSHFKELGLNEGDYVSSESVATLLAEHPRLMQRPVVVRGTRGVIARPSELVESLL
jgi:arsenate reductase